MASPKSFRIVIQDQADPRPALQLSGLSLYDLPDLRTRKLAVAWKTNPKDSPRKLTLLRGVEPLPTSGDGSPTVRVDAAQLLVALTPSRVVEQDAGVRPYLVVTTADGTQVIAVTTEPLSAQQFDIPFSRALSNSGEASSATSQPGVRRGPSIWRARIGVSPVFLDFCVLLGIGGDSLEIRLRRLNDNVWPVLPEGENGKIELGAERLKAGVNRFQYQATSSSTHQIAIGSVVVFVLSSVWLSCLVGLLLLVGWGLASLIVKASLYAEDIDYAKRIGQRPLEADGKDSLTLCHDDSLKYPALGRPYAASAQPGLEVKEGPACPQGGKSWIITAALGVRAGTYKISHSAKVFLYSSDEATIKNVVVVEPIDLKLEPRRTFCLAQGAPISVDLEEQAKLYTKGNALRVVDTWANPDLTVSWPKHDATSPLHAEVQAPSVGRGPHVIRYKLTAGNKTSNEGIIEFNVQPNCGSSQPGSPTPPPTPSPTPPQPQPPSGPTPGPGPSPTLLTFQTSVPLTGGILLPLSYDKFSRDPAKPLPTITITTPPQHASALVVGQFMLFRDVNTTHGNTDIIAFEYEDQGQIRGAQLRITYKKELCRSRFPQERLFYLPSGTYFGPMEDHGMKQMFNESWAEVKEVERSVTLKNGICIQEVEQGFDDNIIQEVMKTRPKEIAQMKQDITKEPLPGLPWAPLYWITYEIADEIARIKSIGGTAPYSIPEATQWMAGWVVANELERLGDLAAQQRYKDFSESFNAGVHEWTSTQWGAGAAKPQRKYVLGTSILDKKLWFFHPDKNSPRIDIGVRFIRDP